MKSYITLLFVAFVMISISACKHTHLAASQTASWGSSCACGDLECWRTQTTSTVRDQLSCASNALTSAADLSTGGSVTVVRILYAMSNILALA